MYEYTIKRNGNYIITVRADSVGQAIALAGITDAKALSVKRERN